MMCNIMKGHYCSSSYFEQYFYFYSFFYSFSTYHCLLVVYLRERSHVPETAAWPGPGAGPEFYAETSRGPGPNPREDPLLLYRVEQGVHWHHFQYTFWSSSAAIAPDVTCRTCPVEGEDVSVALGGVGLRAAAGETTGLPPRGAGVFCCHLQLWTHDTSRMKKGNTEEKGNNRVWSSKRGKYRRVGSNEM